MVMRKFFTSAAALALCTAALWPDAIAPQSLRGQTSSGKKGADAPPSKLPVPGGAGPLVVDNRGAGFTVAGTWATHTGQGFQNDIRSAPAGTGSSLARWTFGGLAPGQYRV